MRNALLVAVPFLLVALAGCTGTTDDKDISDPDDGPDTGPDDPGTGSGDDTGGDQGWDRATNASFPGLVLEGTVGEDTATGNATITASVRFEGDGGHDYKVSAICAEPWRESMRLEGDEVQHREPVAQCEAFGLKPFEDDSRVFSWNLTLWHEDADGSGSGEYRPAEDGDYTWRIHFDVYKGGDESFEFEDFTTLTIEFQADL